VNSTHDGVQHRWQLRTAVLQHVYMWHVCMLCSRRWKCNSLVACVLPHQRINRSDQGVLTRRNFDATSSLPLTGGTIIVDWCTLHPPSWRRHTPRLLHIHWQWPDPDQPKTGTEEVSTSSWPQTNPSPHLHWSGARNWDGGVCSET
jgi:hypothetical protein